MAKTVTTKMKPWVGEGVITALISQLKKDLGDNVQSWLEINRDTNGRIISVKILVPYEVTRNSITNLIANIQANSDVDLVIGPQHAQDIFDELTPGATILPPSTAQKVFFTKSGVTYPFIVNNAFDINLVAAQPADAVGGVGSAKNTIVINTRAR